MSCKIYNLCRLILKFEWLNWTIFDSKELEEALVMWDKNNGSNRGRDQEIRYAFIDFWWESNLCLLQQPKLGLSSLFEKFRGLECITVRRVLHQFIATIFFVYQFKFQKASIMQVLANELKRFIKSRSRVIDLVA